MFPKTFLQWCIATSILLQLSETTGTEFLQEPHDIIAIIGGTTKLTCILKTFGTRPQWMHNDKFLKNDIEGSFPNDPRFKIPSTNPLDFSLEINNVTQEDAGNYQCLLYHPNDIQPVFSRVATLVVVGAKDVKPPELGTNFIRYISLASFSVECQLVTVQGNISAKEIARSPWINASTDSTLNVILATFSGNKYECKIFDPALDNMPPFTLTATFLLSGFDLTASLGAKQSDQLSCRIQRSNDSVMKFFCNKFPILDIPEMVIELRAAFPFTIICTVRTTSIAYSFFLTELPAARFKDAGYNFDAYSYKRLSPALTKWVKVSNSASTVNAVAEVKDKNETCVPEKRLVMLTLVIGHENHNLQLEVPFSIGGDSNIANCGIFQMTCYYWIWKDKVFTIFHEGLVVPYICKIVTLQIKVVVGDKREFDLTNPNCILLNYPRPQQTALLPHFEKVSNIYPLVGIICLASVIVIMMVYLCRQLLTLYRRGGKKKRRQNQKDTLPHVVPEVRKKTYARFTNDDEVIPNKVTLI